MIVPVLKDEAFLGDVRAANESSAEAPHFRLWWLGQSGFLLQWQGSHLLFDPYLSDSLTKKYAATDKPHIRMTERIVDPRKLDFVDVATSTHNHTDHLDAETLIPLLEANPDLALVVPEANRSFAAERLGVGPDRLTPVDAGQSVVCGPFRIHGVPAAHERMECDGQGRYRFLGYLVEFGPWAVYHSGDTVPVDSLVDWLEPWSIDVAILPINGRLPERRVAGNLWGAEAVELAKNIGAKLVIPCHFEMFEFNTVTPEAFKRAARGQDQACRVLRCGERWSSQTLYHA